jgi:hypothetical protein
VDVESDVGLIGNGWLPGVNTHADPELDAISEVVGRKLPLRRHRSRDRVLYARE